jgi:hypothetical protein
MGTSSRGVKLTTDLHLVTTSRMVELYLHSPIRLHGIVLNEAQAQLLAYEREQEVAGCCVVEENSHNLQPPLLPGVMQKCN